MAYSSANGAAMFAAEGVVRKTSKKQTEKTNHISETWMDKLFSYKILLDPQKHLSQADKVQKNKTAQG